MDPHLACGVPHFIDALPRAGVSTSASTSGISCDNCNSVVNVNVEFMELICGVGDFVDIEKC